MCGRQTNTFSWAQIRELLTFGGIQADFGDFDPDRPRFNLAPGQRHYVIGGVIGAEEAQLRARPALWGLIPHWAKDRNIAQKTFNARGESVADKPSFRDAFRSGRCLVPASGYYEWSGPKGKRQAYWIHPEAGDPIFFAGLHSLWTKGEAPLHSYSVVTRPSEGRLREIHPRMPLVLAADAWEDWLFGAAEDTDPLRMHALVDELDLRPVSTRVNSVENDDARLLDETQPPREEPEQGSLF